VLEEQRYIGSIQAAEANGLILAGLAI